MRGTVWQRCAHNAGAKLSSALPWVCIENNRKALVPHVPCASTAVSEHSDPMFPLVGPTTSFGVENARSRGHAPIVEGKRGGMAVTVVSTPNSILLDIATQRCL